MRRAAQQEMPRAVPATVTERQASVLAGSDPLSAFTAEDTVDIMLSSVGAEVVVPAPEAPPVEAAAAESTADTEEPSKEPIETPPDIPQTKEEKKKKKRISSSDSSFFFAGESRIFTLVMVLAALILTAILIVGIIRARNEGAADTASAVNAPMTYSISASQSTEGRYAR